MHKNFLLKILLVILPAAAAAQQKMTAKKDYGYKIEEYVLKATPYLYTTKYPSIRNISSETFFGLYMDREVMKKQGLKMAGPPFCIFYRMDDWDMMIDVCVPVDRMPKDDNLVKAGKIKPGKAVVVHYLGPHKETKKGHAAAKQYIADTKKTITGPPWEAYITDPSAESDTARWQTDIYYPVK